MALSVFEPMSDFEVTEPPVTNLPILLGVMLFSMGVIKFNTLSKWYNPYLEYDGILIKSHFQVLSNEML